MERSKSSIHLKDVMRWAAALVLSGILIGGGAVLLEENSKKPQVLARGPYELTLIAVCGSSLTLLDELGRSYTRGGGLASESGMPLYDVVAGANPALLSEAAVEINADEVAVFIDHGRRSDAIPGIYRFGATADAVFVDGRNINFVSLKGISGTLICPSQFITGLLNTAVKTFDRFRS